MEYYLVREVDTNNYAKGTPKGGYGKKNIGGPIDRVPPKLYTYGSAKQLQSVYANQHSIELEIIPVKLVFSS